MTMENTKFDVLQILLACDRDDGKKTISRPAINEIIHQTRVLKEVLIVGGESYDMQTGVPSDNLDIYGFDFDTGTWKEKEYKLPANLAIRNAATTSYTTMRDGSTMVCVATSANTDAIGYIFHPHSPENRFEELPEEDKINYACRNSATLITLHDGSVLRLGGSILPSVFEDNPRVKQNASYNPATKTWTETRLARTIPLNPACVVLANGDVLISGGVDYGNILGTCMIYHPASGLFSDTGSMTTNRHQHAACLLANGDVFVHGGNGVGDIPERTYEVYVTEIGQWRRVGRNRIGEKRYSHTCILMPNGEVLINGNGYGVFQTMAYDPVTMRIRYLDHPPMKLSTYMTIPVYE